MPVNYFTNVDHLPGDLESAKAAARAAADAHGTARYVVAVQRWYGPAGEYRLAGFVVRRHRSRLSWEYPTLGLHRRKIEYMAVPCGGQR